MMGQVPRRRVQAGQVQVKQDQPLLYQQRQLIVARIAVPLQQHQRLIQMGT